MRIHWISSPNLSKSRRQGRPVRSYISLFSRVRESPPFNPRSSPSIWRQVRHFLTIKQFFASCRRESGKTICKGGWAMIEFFHDSTSSTVNAPIVSWVAIFRRSPKKSFSSNRQLLQTIFLFAPSGSILVKTGNI